MKPASSSERLAADGLVPGAELVPQQARLSLPQGSTPLPFRAAEPAQTLSEQQRIALDDPDVLAQCVVEVPLGTRMRRIGLGLSGMYCAACAITIENALRKVPGVQEVQVQSVSQRARILVDPRVVQLSALVAAVQAVGYRAWPDAAARAGHERLRERRKLLWRLSAASLCTMQVMMMTTPQYVAGRSGMPVDLWNLLNWATWVLSLPVMIFSCGPFFKGAWVAARQGRVAMDTPVALGIAVTFVVSTAIAFGAHSPFGQTPYFDSLTMFVTFLLAGRWLESRARERVTQSLESLCLRLPEAVERVAGDTPEGHAQLVPADDAPLESVPLSALKHGDRLRIAVGQAFAADGLLLSGPTEVDESLLSGESRSVSRQAGQTVVAGSINLGAVVWLSVQRLGPDTRYQQIVALVLQAMTQKPGWMGVADRLAGPFLWSVLSLALGAALVWQGIDPSRSVWVAVSVLIVTCPCALSLAGPMALLSAAGALAREGVLVRRLDALETLAEPVRVYADKTGTLTLAQQSVVGLFSQGHMHGFGQTSQQEHWPAALKQLWQQALELAACSQHPLSRSLVEAALACGQTVHAGALQSAQEIAGCGVQAGDSQGRVWRLGRADWVLGQAHERLVWPTDTPASEAPWCDADVRLWLACVQPSEDVARPARQVQADSVLGVVLDEVVRPQAHASVLALERLGCTPSVLSGDRIERVQKLAQALTLANGQSLPVAAAQATPQDKRELISRLQASGQRVVVVGDGINDAPVLAQADVSVVLDQGAALAQSQADLLILDGRLSGLPRAIEMGRRARRVVRQNLAWAVVYNLACIPLALSGHLPPWAAGLGMATSSLLVVLNSLRLGASPWKSSTS